ncbi:MAG: hypothetical protein ACKV2T_05090 [Kofleriaceae bacterium]
MAVVGLVGLVGPARADVIDLPETRAELTLDVRVWRAVTTAHATAGTTSGLVAAYATDRELLAITRAQLPNIDAWRAKHRDAYIEQIERGLVNAGYKPSGRKLTTIEGVPVLDLEATPSGTATSSPSNASGSSSAPRKRQPIVLRVILFRTYALSLALEGPRSSRTKLRAIAKTFVPPPARPEGSP